MACDECRDLNTHLFRSPADMVNAVQVAAQEQDRGVLERLRVDEGTLPEQAALRSALQSGALPDIVLYRFKCTVCNDTFELFADTQQGKGGWTRSSSTRPA